jgi:hypothetical protein
MKVKLLNNGGFLGFGKTKFPVIVEGSFHKEDIGRKAHFKVSASELKRIGGRFVPDCGLNFTTDEAEEAE